MINKLKKIPGFIFRFIIVNTFRWFYYDSKYFNSRWFSKITSKGWEWTFRDILHRMLFRTNLNIPWPLSPYIDCGPNIQFDIDDLNNFMGFGNYYQTFDAKIIIGKGCWIARNVGIITSNHDLQNPDLHEHGKDVILGDHCWIGMNAVILPGVYLGPHTVVGAGSVVTKSFPSGYCVVAGNPARKIRSIQNNLSYYDI